MHRIALVALLAACSSRSTPAQAPPPGSGSAAGSAATAPTPAPEPTLDPSAIPIDEAQFKAMHQLTGAAAPPLAGQEVELAGGRAYLSLPRGATGPVPGIVVIHEWWGLNDHVKHWTDRLASAGYAAIAVDLYGGVRATTPDEAMAAMSSVDNTAAARVISAALDYLATDPRIRAPKRGVIGWCFGGGWSLRTALAHPELDAAVMYYGRLEADPTKLAAIKADLLGIFGNRDKGIPPQEVDAFDAALSKAGVSHAIHRYDAEHAFANPSSARYDEVSAADAWEKVVAFLDATLRR